MGSAAGDQAHGRWGTSLYLPAVPGVPREWTCSLLNGSSQARTLEPVPGRSSSTILGGEDASTAALGVLGRITVCPGQGILLLAENLKP